MPLDTSNVKWKSERARELGRQLNCPVDSKKTGAKKWASTDSTQINSSMRRCDWQKPAQAHLRAGTRLRLRVVIRTATPVAAALSDK